MTSRRTKLASTEAVADRTPEMPDDAAMALSARQLAHLEELREIGMMLARELGKQAAAPTAERTDAGCGVDIGLAFSRIARSVRQIVALEQEVAGLREQRRSGLRRAALSNKKQTIRRAIRDAVRADEPDIDQEDLNERLDDLFDDYNDYRDLDYANGAVGEIVARICRDLGVEPDPTLWPEAASQYASETPASGSRDGCFPDSDFSGGRRSSPSRAGPGGHDPP